MWEQHSDAMRQALVRHDAIVAACVEQYSGILVGERGEGDSCFAVFAQATNAVAAAVAVQRALASEPWPDPLSIRVRMALHTGEADARADNFYGSQVNRCSRIRSLAVGGQTLVSQATRNLVVEALPAGVSLQDLGRHRLRDLQRPERIYQLVIPGLPGEFPPLKSLDTAPNNFPIQLTSFIGREREIEKLVQQLNPARLVTLIGPGGCGKTRLALQAAAGLVDQYADGVWVVELAPLSDPLLVAQTVANVLGVQDVATKPIQSTLSTALKSKSLLLILDNCEHVVEACASLAEALLQACPNLKLLATSREVLGIAGEVTFRVPSLGVPELDPRLSVDALMQSESAHLFAERASAVNSEFRVVDTASIAQICRRLDGIPLAIELAAAKVKVMTPAQIAARLDDRFRLLTGGNRTALPRQQTLRALIDWSYDLLSDAERLLLQRLSVFAGGATFDAVDSICACQPGEEYDVLSILSHLVDKSLVYAVEQNGEMRYRMLETLRQYAQEKLIPAGDTERLRSCHCDFYLRLAEQAEPNLRNANQQLWLNRLDADYDNILAALEWSLTNADAETTFRLGGALWLFWNVRGYWTQGRERLARILALPSERIPVPVHAKALNAAGFLALLQADYAVARELLEKSLDLGRNLDQATFIADALYGLGSVSQMQGDYASAYSLNRRALDLFTSAADRWGMAGALLCLGSLRAYEENYQEARTFFKASLEAFREIGDRRNMAKLLGNVGLIAYFQGDYAAARSLYEEGLDIRRELRDKAGIASLLDNLGYVALQQQDLDQARILFAESLGLLYEIKSKRWVADVLCGLAGVAARQEHWDRAARLYGAGQSILESIGVKVEGSNRAEYERVIAPARAGLGETAFEAECGQGRQMTMEQAVAFAQAEE